MPIWRTATSSPSGWLSQTPAGEPSVAISTAQHGCLHWPAWRHSTPLPRPGGTSPTGPFGELFSCQRPVGGGCRTPNSFPHPVSGTDLYRRAATTAHRLRVSLDRSEPEIWREVVVPSGFSLGELHTVIQVAMGWQDYHLHHFHIDGQRYTELNDLDDDWGQPGVDENVSAIERRGWPTEAFLL